MKNNFFSKKTYDLALIGLGTSGKEHLKYYLKKTEVEKIFVSDFKKLKNFKNKKIIFDPKLKKFKFSKNPKIVSISSYDQDHFNKIIKYYPTAHIFVEKPLCRKFPEIKKIFKMIKKMNFKYLLNSNLVLRKAKIFNQILDQIRKGKFGKIYYFEGDYLYGRLNKLLRGWRGKDNFYSVFLGGGIHMVDLMIKFMQSLPYNVSSSSNKIVTSQDKFKFNDFVQSTFHFKNGAIGKISANFGCVHKHQHVIKVFGTKKSFIYDDMGARIFERRDPAKSKKIKIGKKIYNGKACLLPDFFSKIKSGKKHSKDIIKEINLISACVFADQAVAKKRKLKIRYFK